MELRDVVGFLCFVGVAAIGYRDFGVLGAILLPATIIAVVLAFGRTNGPS